MIGKAPRRADRFMPAFNTLVLGSIAMCLAVGGGITNYRDRVRLTSDRAWVEHTHDVLRAVHALDYQLNMTKSSALLYNATHAPNDLRIYGGWVENLDAGLTKTDQFTNDNRVQQERVKRLRQILAPLRADPLQVFAPRGMSDTGDSRAGLVIRQGMDLIAVMGMDEYRLLGERNEVLTRSSRKSSIASLTYLSLSTVIVLALQFLLLRHFGRQKQLEAEMSVANALLRQKITESEALVYASNELSLCTTPIEAHNALTRICASLMPQTGGAVAMINNSRQIVEVCATWGNVDNLQRVFSPDCCCALRSGRVRERKPDLAAVDCNHFEDGEHTSYVCLPLSAQGETMGVLHINGSTFSGQSDLGQSIQLIQEIAEVASITIANLNLREKLRNQSIRDGLTGLFNRSFMETTLDREIRRAARQNLPLSLIMLDVDHFKKLNDTYGHVTGDQALQSLAFILQQNVRAEDTVCRYGGEEFILILPHADGALAYQRAEMLRTKVQEHHLMHDHEFIRGMTISLGVATFPGDGSTLPDLLKAADSCLYRAKNAGRNQTVLSDLVEVH